MIKEQTMQNDLIVNINDLGSSNDRIFFGDYSGFQRFDKPAFISAVKLEESMRNAFWNPNEVSMRDDAVKFHLMPAPVQDAMCKIWLYQTLMDSAQNRGLEETIVDFVTNPEFECLFKTWGYFEMIHSISYSHIIRGIFVDSVDVFERNLNNEDIINRVRTEIEQYSDIANHTKDLEGSSAASEDNAKKIIELILTIYALEGIKFYASFLYTYLIHDRYGSLPGTTRIIKLINFDENSHANASVVLLKELSKDPTFKPVLESDWFGEAAKRVFTRVLNDEKSFAHYLADVMQEHNPISKENISNFLECYVDRRLKAIGVENITNTPVTPIVEWFDVYQDLNAENIALQESDMAAYNIGVMKDDM